MPPRHAYWTILVDNQPTAFRAHDVEELLPTFNRLKQKHPSAVMKWFERGQLWESRDDARHAERQPHGTKERSKSEDHGGNRPRWQERNGRAPGNRHALSNDRPRDKNWRPGGDHRDPRQRFKDAKKAKWTRFKQNVRTRWEEQQLEPGRKSWPRQEQGGGARPSGPDRSKPKPKWTDRPRQARDDRGEWSRPDRPWGRDRAWRPKDPHGGARTQGRGPGEWPSRRPDDRGGRDRPEGERKWGNRRPSDRDAKARPPQDRKPDWASSPSPPDQKRAHSTGFKRSFGSGAHGRKPWAAKPRDSRPGKPFPPGSRRPPRNNSRGPRKPRDDE